MRSGIVGCGIIAVMHADVIRGLVDNELVAVADIDFEKSEGFAKEYGGKGCNPYSSLEEMCSNESIDVLHICTPHYLHVPMAIYALEHGINVFMEKPPAISREQLNLLNKVKKDKLLGICFQNRFNESTKAVLDLLKDPEVGKVKGARAFVTWNRSKEYYSDGPWRGSWELEGGGALINQSIHTLDLLVQFMGKPIRSEASMHNHHLKGVIDVEDTVEAYIEFQKGPVLFYATTANYSNSPVLIELECENATIRIEGTDVTKVNPDGMKENITFHKGVSLGKDYWGYGHMACIQSYYNCLKTGERFPIQLEDIKDTFTLMMDIYQSAKERKVIEFDKKQKLSGFADEIDPDFDKQLEVLQECNMSYIELRGVNGRSISSYSLEEARFLKEKMDMTGIKVSAIGSPIGKIDIKEDFEAHYELFCHVVELAKLFETKCIRVFSFFIPEGEIAENYKIIVLERLKRMITYAKEKGVVLLHENEKEIYGDTIVRCKELMEALSCENFKMTFDFANFIQCGQNPWEAFVALKPYIAYVHIKDARMDNHMVVPAGFGDGQIRDIVMVLEAERYEGFYSLEPHLTEFAGLQDLEGSNKTQIEDDMNDGRSAFITAYNAFATIIKGI